MQGRADGLPVDRLTEREQIRHGLGGREACLGRLVADAVVAYLLDVRVGGVDGDDGGKRALCFGVIRPVSVDFVAFKRDMRDR